MAWKGNGVRLLFAAGAMLVGWLPGAAMAQQGVECAVLEAQLDDLAVAYAASLADLLAAAEELDAATEARTTYYRNNLGSLVRAAGADQDMDDSLNLLLNFESAVFLAGLQAHERRIEAANAQGLRAQNAMIALELTFNSVAAATARSCAAGGTGQTIDPDKGDEETTATAPGQAGNTDAAAPSAQLQAGFYGDNFGDVYVFSGGSFLTYPAGTVAMTITCGGGQQELSTGARGDYCTGQWFNSAGEYRGNYEGVVFIRESDGQLRLVGLYDSGSGTAQNNWNLSRYTDAEAAEAGLSFDPG